MDRKSARRSLSAIAALIATLGVAGADFVNVDTPCAPGAAGDAVEGRYRALLADAAPLDQEIGSFYARCGSGVKSGSAEDNQCKADKASLDARWEAYDRALASYEADRRRARDDGAATRAERIAALDNKIAMTRTKIAVAGARMRIVQDDLKEWEDLAENARQDVRANAFSALKDVALDVGLARVQAHSEAQLALDEAQLAAIQRSIGQFILPKGFKLSRAQIISLHYWDWYWETYGPRLVLRMQRNRTVIDTLKAVKELNDAVEGIAATNALVRNDGSRASILKGSAEVLKLLVKDPGLKLLINDWQVNFSLGYLFVAEGEAMDRVVQFNAVQDSALKGLTSLSALYKRQIDERAALKRAANATDAPACR